MGPSGELPNTAWLTLGQMLRLRADEFEAQRGGTVGPSLVMLLRDAAAAVDGR